MEGTTIGAVMIVRNEETTLGGILSDIKGVVDEICVVDTGSTDSTVALAESFGARVHHFPWIDDFSAARNHSIACARSDYLIWLDADDRIDEASRQALLELKQRLKPQKNKAYMLKIIGCSEDMPETVSFQTRIVPNVRDVCFEGRVHEQILPSLTRLGIAIAEADITIRHTGYHSPEQRRAKAARNLAILERELADGKDTATQYFFMAMAAIGLGEHERCLEYIENARKRRTNEDWLHYSHVISCECLFRLGRFQDAMAELERGTGLFPSSRLLHYYLGTTCMKLGRHERARDMFQKALTLPERIDTYPVPPQLDCFIKAQLCKALEKTGQTDKALQLCRDALRKSEAPRTFHHEMGLLLIGMGKAQEAVFHLEEARKASDKIDVPLWLSLAAVYRSMGLYEEAHGLYVEVIRESEPASLVCLEGVLYTSIELDNIDAFFDALERFMTIMNIPIPEEAIETVEECARLCLNIAAILKDTGNHDLAERMAQISLRLDNSCWGAYLVLAEIYAERGETQKMIDSVETSLKYGADRQEILQLLQRYQPH